MTPAPRLDVRPSDADRQPVVPLPRHSIVGKLRGSGRADVAICLPQGASSVDELVVVKTFASESMAGAARPALPDELQLASALRHDNIVATLGLGYEAGRHFIVSEYLEGTTLARLLRWLGSRSERLPNAAVVRILLGLFAAVEHGHRWATTPATRALVHEVITADDVFITDAGHVKLLGFKPARALDGAEPVGEPSVGRAAVDALLSTQLSAELATVLGRVGARVSPASMLGLWQIARALHTWQAEELKSDGRRELAAIMAGVLPDGRAKRRTLLAAACERVVRARQPVGDDGRSSVDEAQPVSGYRMVLPDLTSAIGAGPSTARVASSTALSIVGRDLAPTRPAAAATTRSVTSPAARQRGASWTLSLVLGLLGLGALSALSARTLRSAPDVASTAQAEARPPLSAESPRYSPSPHALPPALPSGSASSSAPAAPAAPAAAAPSSDPPAERSLPVGASRAKLGEKARVGSARAEPASARSGFLTLDTTPWSSVSWGNTALGHTPLVKVELPPGQHELALENEELGIVSSVIVDIASDATTVRRVGLERPLHAARR